MLWSVYIETEAPTGAAKEPLEAMHARADRLLEVLAPWHGIVTAGAQSWTAQLDVDTDTDDAVAATAEGWRVAGGAARAVGMPSWPVVRCEAMTVDAQAAELVVEQVPELVGSQEVVGLLGVSRQRVHQLRADRAFPEPLVQLGAGPVWVKAAIEAFVDRWDRTPGRRPAAARARIVRELDVSGVFIEELAEVAQVAGDSPPFAASGPA